MVQGTSTSRRNGCKCGSYWAFMSTLQRLVGFCFLGFFPKLMGVTDSVQLQTRKHNQGMIQYPVLCWDSCISPFSPFRASTALTFNSQPKLRFLFPHSPALKSAAVSLCWLSQEGFVGFCFMVPVLCFKHLSLVPYKGKRGMRQGTPKRDFCSVVCSN